MPKLIDDRQIYRDVMLTVIERGYAGTTTKQMAAAANISEVTLFRKYGSKAQLVRQAIVHLMTEARFAAEISYTGDISADLLRIVTGYQDSAETEGRFFYALISELPRHPELVDILDTPLGVMSRVGQVVARYQAEGILKQEHPLHAVVALIGPLIVTNMLRAAAGSLPMPALDLPHHVATFIAGRQITDASKG